jgi:hypothetical protein
MAESDSASGWLLAGVILLAVCYVAEKDTQIGDVRKGDLSPQGGSPTVRRSFEPQPDDPCTSNDESNDQPLGHFGTLTLSIAGEAGNIYTLDGELEGLELHRVYFPRGGWVDFLGCELETDLTGMCFDEEGRSWTIYGEAEGYATSWVDEEQEDEDNQYDGDAEDGDEDEGDSGDYQ